MAWTLKLSVVCCWASTPFSLETPTSPPVTEKEVFLDPVTENPEATLEGLMSGDGAGTGTDQAKVVRGWKETLQNLKSFTSNYYHRNQMKAEDGN